MKLSSWEFLEEVSGYHNQYLAFIDNRYGKFMFCGPGCPHWATGPMILIHIRSHLKLLSGQVYKCVWAPWAKINSFQVGWDVVFHAVALASCVLVEDGKSNTTSRNHELSQCETVTKREFLRAQFGIVVCCCWSYIFGLVFPGFQIVPDILVTTSTTSPTTAIFTTDMYPCQLRRIPGAPVLLSVNDVDNRIEQRKNTHTH